VSNLLYVFAVLLFFTSFLGVVIADDLLRKIILLSIMQSSVIIFFVEAGYKTGIFFSPIQKSVTAQYVNPVTHVLMLTAIVVGFATTSIAIAIVMKIKQKTGMYLYSEITQTLEDSQNEF
jgi:multicomponent Na+:H+ antiporter subunit C